ncbi:MAG TPA: hypothetical protein VGS16_09525 [Candidatus Dormibacteraeota bacterium]|nr:hypothetical protein [Candidatus Dormibacteraeota bacterium]
MRLALLLVVAAIAGACSGFGSAAKSPSPVASSSRTTSPSAPSSGSPSPVALTGAFGVLVSPLSSTNYTVSLVGIDGRVVSSAIASSPSAVNCANAAAAVVPLPVSTSNTRVYFMDALGAVRFLAPNGDMGQTVTLPIGPGRRSMFAVSPDDSLMAVVVVDFTATGATTKLYLYQLQPGGAQLQTFAQTGAFTLRPTGWRGSTGLVLAKVPACVPGSGPFCCGPQEFHIVDPKTAVRRFTIGGPTCVIAGPPSPAGAVCENNAYDVATVLDWTAAQTNGFPIGGPTLAYISPTGQSVAVISGATTSIYKTNTTFGFQACGWIDDTHILAGGDAQQQPRVADLTSSNVVPVAAQGDCGGRIPGGL